MVARVDDNLLPLLRMDLGYDNINNDMLDMLDYG